MFAVIALAHYSCAPIQEHLKSAPRVFGYLKRYPRGAIRFNTDLSDTPEAKNQIKNGKIYIPMQKKIFLGMLQNPKKMD